MLSAMYTYCPPGPQPPKTGTVPYQYIGDPLPQSPTLSPYLYARPPFPGNPFSTPPSVAQGLIPHPTATVALSHDAATALISLGREQVGHIGESASPDANGKALSPIKLEQMSPESAATPPISVTIEADSSTTSNEQSYKSTQNPSMTIEVSEPQDTSNPSYPTIPHMFTDTTRISCPPREFEATYPHVQSSALQIPYTHSPTFTQPAQSSYTTIRYPPTASAMPQIGPISYFPQLPSRTDAIFPRNNSCHLCGKTYARLSTLKTHLRSHSGEKPYQCSICQKSFTQAANLTAHLRTHSGEKPFKCPICNRGFSQSSSVTTHMRTHSGDRPYKCTVCNKGFADSSTLTKHFRTHTGEKPYQCKICDARFSQSGNLNRHMRTHRNHFPVLGHIQQ